MNYPAQSIYLDSSYIHSIWTGEAPRDDTHVAAADGNLDLVIMKRADKVKLLLSGPTTAAKYVPYKQGDQNTGIRLRYGVHVPNLPASQILNTDWFLPSAGGRSFWFQGSVVPFPTFNTLEVFVDRLVKLGMLQRDVVVEDALAGRDRGLSERTIQRHFLQVSGVTPDYFRQIRRAEQAADLLHRGHDISEVVADLGYSHQSHMTNSLHRLVGYTPGQLRSGSALA